MPIGEEKEKRRLLPVQSPLGTYLHEASARRADFLSARIAPLSSMGKEEVGSPLNSHKTAGKGE